MVMAFFWMLIGFWHICVVVASLMGASNPDEWGSGFAMQSSCQGSACHEEQIHRFISCDGWYRSTYEIRYLTIGIGGLFFGCMGFQGVTSRSQAMMKTFGRFFFGMTILMLVLFLADQGYTEYCEYMPRNMQLDVQMFLLYSRERYAMMRAQGYKDFSKVSTSRVSILLGFDWWNALYAGIYVCMLMVMVYCCKEVLEYADNVIEGPVGLGPNFVISHKPDRDVQQMAQRMSDAVEDYFINPPPPNYRKFPELEAGNAFPYKKPSGGVGPSINYGTMGLPMPEPRN